MPAPQSCFLHRWGSSSGRRPPLPPQPGTPTPPRLLFLLSFEFLLVDERARHLKQAFERNLGLFRHTANRPDRTFKEDQQDFVVEYPQPAQTADRRPLTGSLDALHELTQVLVLYSGPKALR